MSVCWVAEIVKKKSFSMQIINAGISLTWMSGIGLCLPGRVTELRRQIIFDILCVGAKPFFPLHHMILSEIVCFFSIFSFIWGHWMNACQHMRSSIYICHFTCDRRMMNGIFVLEHKSKSAKCFWFALNMTLTTSSYDGNNRPWN